MLLNTLDSMGGKKEEENGLKTLSRYSPVIVITYRVMYSLVNLVVLYGILSMPDRQTDPKVAL